MHTVAVLAMPDTIAFDLATPLEVFGRVGLSDGSPGYRVLVCGSAPVVTAGPMRIATEHGLDDLASADIIVVPARHNPMAGNPPGVDDALHAALARGARVASICAGAFTLAADAARLAVAPLHRSGGQAQFIMRNRRANGTQFSDLLAWIEEHAYRQLTLEDVAA